MTKRNDNTRQYKATERSFTLVETMIALGLMVFLIAQFTTIQGTAVSAAAYGRKVAQATWLAKRLMAQVEYYSATKKWADLSTSNSDKDHPFEDFPDYKYDLEIKEWKLPLLSMLGQTLGGGQKKEGESKDDTKGAGPFEGMLKQILGEDLLKVAYVEVFWTEGATRDSVSLTYLLVNQTKVDEVIGTLKAVADASGGQTAGATAGGTTAGTTAGATAGGTTAGGTTAGGTTAGGTTAGGTTAGTTAGGTTAGTGGATTAGGTTAGGTTTGGITGRTP